MAQSFDDLERPASGNILTFDDTEGRKVVAQITGVGQFPWQILAAIPTEDAFSHVQEMMRLIVLALVVFGTLSALLALRLSVTITRPLREAAAGALAIGMGDLTYRIMVRSSDEAGYLARRINDMASNIEPSRSQLVQAERRIAYQDMSERIVQAVPISVAVVDEEGHLMSANRGFFKTFYLVQEESLDQPLAELVELG